MTIHEEMREKEAQAQRIDARIRKQKEELKARHQKMLLKLQHLTADCREDMHEPDEQNVTAQVIGSHLDNAFGTQIGRDQVAVDKGEFVVILHRQTKVYGMQSFAINLCDLIALARKAKID